MIISRVDRKYKTDCFSKLSYSYESISGAFLTNLSCVCDTNVPIIKLQMLNDFLWPELHYRYTFYVVQNVIIRIAYYETLYKD